MVIMKTLRVYFDIGPLALSLSAGVRKITVGENSVMLRLFLKLSNCVPSVSGWSIRELHMPHAVYGLLLENMRKANISLREAGIQVETSENGTEIFVFVFSDDPSSLRCVDRSVAVIQTDRTIFFPFRTRSVPGVSRGNKEIIT